jgi:PAS domain S-box-containing protein
LLTRRKRFQDLDRADIEAKAMEIKVKKNKEKYFSLVNNAPQPITVAQGENFKFVNQKAVEIFGYSRKQMLSMPFVDLFHPDDRQIVSQHYQERLQNPEKLQGYEVRILTRDGETKWFESNATAISWEGSPATLNILTDITGRKQTETALANAKKQWVDTFDAVWDWVTVIDEDQSILCSNRASQNFCSLSPEQVVGQRCYQIVHGTQCSIPGCPM